MRKILTHPTPLKVIRLKCLECAGSFKAIKDCVSIDCPLYIYRFGHNPALKGKRRPNICLWQSSKKPNTLMCE